ncbi:tRNA (guanine-N(7)-)-methyltransferase non-catalytic subunit trm82 [Rhodotorula kratochvilovae]
MADAVHPVQALATTADHLITASNTQLAVFDVATTALIARASHHKALVRLIAPFVDEVTGKRYLISTGEDKLLLVSALPSLEVLSTRELPKRANALDVTATGEIVVGDKFGDVYIFPLDAPVISAGTKPEDMPKPQPILGHVSMLNTLALIPADPANGLPRDWIATGDRDEHVRISRFPAGHVIEKYGWGSKSFVSSLLYLPSPPSSPTPQPPYLLSAGADSTIQVFALPSADLVAQFPIQDLLFPYLAVGPEAPTPIPAGRKKSKTGPKGKGKQPDSAAATETEEGTPAAEDSPAPESAAQDAPPGSRELTKGLAVVKLLSVGPSRETGGVLVLAAGSTALLYIPFSLLLPTSTSTASDPPAVPSLLQFAHPILDFAPAPIPSAAGSAAEFLLALDTTRPTPSADPTPLVRVSLSPTGQLAAVPTLTTDAVFLGSACAVLTGQATGAKPSVASLYPALQLLHHPGDEEFASGPAAGEDLPADAEALAAAGVGDGKPKGGRGFKRPLPPASEAGTEGSERFRVGKRAIGRAETLRRFEEAKRKLLAPGGEALTEGEKAAVQEIEGEARDASAVEGAEMEVAKVA